MSRNDYRVTVKVRNNNILSAADDKGLSIPKLAEAIGANYAFLNDLVNMTASPFGRYGKVRWQVEALCTYLEKSFDELFSSEQCTALETNKSEAAMNAEQVFAITNAGAGFSVIEHDDGLAQTVSGLMDTLTTREQKVLSLRYGFDGGDGETLRAISDAFGVTPARIRQIEMKALRKLRHPSRSNGLLPFVESA